MNHNKLETEFHKKIKQFLNKTLQGRVMGSFRNTLAENKDACEDPRVDLLILARKDSLERIATFVANDSLATTYQTFGQYRTDILRLINDEISK